MANVDVDVDDVGVDLGININNYSSSSSSHPSFSPNSNVSSSYDVDIDLHHHHHHHHQNTTTNNNNHNHYYYNHASVDPSSSPPHTLLQQKMRMFMPPTTTPTHQLNMTHQFQLHNTTNNIIGVRAAFNPNSGFVHHHRSNSTTNSSSSSVSPTHFQRNTTTTTTTTTTATNAAQGFQRDITKLEQLFSKLNPMAQEFVPPSLTNQNHPSLSLSPSSPSPEALNFLIRHTPNTNTNTSNPSFDFDIVAAANNIKINNIRNNFSYNHFKHKTSNMRTSMAQRDDVIRRTVYVSDIDQQVTERQLAALFVNCGRVVDCRICGDPNSVLRFAFIEFTNEDSARAALSLAGTMIGYYPVRVLPSKTAIAPVDQTFLPRSEDEHEMCSRTVYCTNIDKKISQADVKGFFESLCGKVNRLRLLGDYHHSTRIAFVEFVVAESAILALNCSGVVLGSLPIRVSPSKTPVRPRAPRSQMH